MGEVGPDFDLGAEGNTEAPGGLPESSRDPAQCRAAGGTMQMPPDLSWHQRLGPPSSAPGSSINHKFFSNGKLLAFASWRLGRASTSHISTSAPGVLRGGLEAWVCCGIASLQPPCSGSPYLAAYLHHIGISFSVFTEMSLISKSVQLKSTLSK